MFNPFKLRRLLKERDRTINILLRSKVQELTPGTVCVIHVPSIKDYPRDLYEINEAFRAEIKRVYKKDIPMGVIIISGTNRIELINKGEIDETIGKSN